LLPPKWIPAHPRGESRDKRIDRFPSDPPAPSDANLGGRSDQPDQSGEIIAGDTICAG
jgi:hypothetical protein